MVDDDSLRVRINEYLTFGYLIPDVIGEDSVSFNQTPLDGLEQDEWFEGLGTVLDLVFERILSELPDGATCVVPLSGGWDSRVVLSESIRRLGKERIKTVTFGTPGQFDYDVGNYLAQQLGLNHTALNLDRMVVRLEDFVKTAKSSSWTYMPDAYYNELARQSVCKEGDIVLVGFMGGQTTGALLDKVDKINSISSFMKTQVRGKEIDADIMEKIEKIKIKGNESLDVYFLDFNLRQRHCILPIVSGASSDYRWTERLPVCGSTNSKIFSPFSSEEWMRFWSKVPSNLLRKQRLYLAYFNDKYPDVFSMPSKYSYGLRKRQVFKRLAIYPFLGSKHILDKVIGKKGFFFENSNYINYDSAFSSRDDYREILKLSFEIVSDELGVGNDFEIYYDRHCNSRVSFSEYFLMMIGAAANIRARS